jgi:hypothetical protein
MHVIARSVFQRRSNLVFYAIICLQVRRDCYTADTVLAVGARENKSSGPQPSTCGSLAHEAEEILKD